MNKMVVYGLHHAGRGKYELNKNTTPSSMPTGDVALVTSGSLQEILAKTPVLIRQELRKRGSRLRIGETAQVPLIELTKQEKDTLAAMVNSAAPVPGNVVACKIKEIGDVSEEKRAGLEQFKRVADSLRERGFFIGTGNIYYVTTAAFEELGILKNCAYS